MHSTNLQEQKGWRRFLRHPDKCEMPVVARLEIKPRRKLNHPRIAAQYRGWIQKIVSEWVDLIQSRQTRGTNRIHTINRTRYILRMIEHVEEVSANLDVSR